MIQLCILFIVNFICLLCGEKEVQLKSEAFFPYTILNDKNLLNQCHKELLYLGRYFSLIRKTNCIINILDVIF